MINFLLVAGGGAVGASLRYFSYNLLKYFYPSFPIATLFVNITGSFLIGYLMFYMQDKNISESFIKYFIVIGLLGSYTTFSTFSFDVVDLLNNQKFLVSFFYILFSVSLCIIAAYIGYNLNNI